MADRFVLWARRKREELFDALGRECALCGSNFLPSFDHINPELKDRDAFKRAGFVRRMTLYTRDFKGGNLQVLCVHCNAAKKDRFYSQSEFYPSTDELEANPF
jgi:5-methylcytosine-specific restriction endonuclease McrA